MWRSPPNSGEFWDKSALQKTEKMLKSRDFLEILTVIEF